MRPTAPELPHEHARRLPRRRRSNARATLAIAVLMVIALAAGWLLVRDGEPRAHIAPRDTSEPAAAPTSAVARDVGVAAATRTTAMHESSSAQPPVPPDARWIEVTVVDAGAQEPVPEAEVAYVDDTTPDGYDDPTLTPAERTRCHEDDEARARRFGWRVRADARGKARVHVGERTTVFARSGDRFGRKELDPDDPTPPGGHRVELRLDRTLRVRVVDMAGAPVVGAAVIVETFDAAGAFDGEHRDTIETLAPDGIAVLAHTQDLRRLYHDALDGKGAGWRVRVRLLGVELPGVRFDPQAPPAEPVTLTMPAHGRIRVGSVAYGEAMTRHQSLQWSLRDGHHTVSVPGRPDGPGFASYEPVALQRTFVATCQGAVAQEFAGPVAPGQLVEVLLEPDPTAVFLRGSVLTAAGQPLPDTPLRCTLSWSQRKDDRSLRTDGAGRFLLYADTSAPEGHVHLRALRTTAEGPSFADAGPVPTTAGFHDVGALLLRALPLLVSGTCVEGSKTCAPVDHIVVQRSEAGTWHSCPDWFDRQDGGRFAVHGTVPPGRMRLLCLRDGARSPWVEFEAGATDVVVPMTSDGMFAANVLLPECSDGSARAFVFREPAPNAPRDAAATALHEADLDTRGRALAVVREYVPQPGTYALEIRLWSDDEPLLRITGIEFPSPAGGDPRLASIDLGELVEQLTVEPRDATGERLAALETIKVLPFGRPPANWPVFEAYGFTATTLVRRGGADVWVAVEGFRPQVVRRARGHVVVPLTPWPTVDLRVDVPSGLAADTNVWAGVSEVEPSTPEHPELATCPDHVCDIAGGSVRLPIGDGPHRIVIGVTRRYATEIVAVDGPATVEASPAPVPVRVLPASWQQALDKLAANPASRPKR